MLNEEYDPLIDALSYREDPQHLAEWLRENRNVRLENASDDDLDAYITHMILEEEQEAEAFAFEFGDCSPYEYGGGAKA